MLAASLVTFLAIALHPMVVPLTLLARLAISVVRPATFLATVHKKLPMVTFLVMSLILVPPLSWHLLLPSHRSSGIATVR